MPAFFSLPIIAYSLFNLRHKHTKIRWQLHGLVSKQTRLYQVSGELGPMHGIIAKEKPIVINFTVPSEVVIVCNKR